MKFRHSAFLIFALLIAIGFSSCTHNYVCQCTIKYSGQPGLPDSIVKQYTIKDTHSKAKSLCEGNSGSWMTNGITTKETCILY
jgi:hypothetical protein